MVLNNMKYNEIINTVEIKGAFCGQSVSAYGYRLVAELHILESPVEAAHKSVEQL